MSATTFDTHSFVKRLTAAGMPEPQAEILAEEQSRLIGDGTSTKGDIRTLQSDMKTEFSAVHSDIAVVKVELAMVKWMVGGIGFGMVMLVIKAFTHLGG